MIFTLLAACTLGLTSVNDVTWAGKNSANTYAYNDNTNRNQQVNFTLTYRGGNSCNYFVAFSTGQSNTYSMRTLKMGAHSLNYQIYDTSSLTNVLKDLPTANSDADVIDGSISDNGNPSQTKTRSLRYFLNIPKNQMAQAGLYTDTFYVRAYTGDVDAASTFVTEENVVFSCTVDSITEVALVNTGGAFSTSASSKTIDFGNFNTTQTKDFDMRIRSNAGYAVLMQSANQGVMVRTTAPNTTLSYTLSVSGTPITLTSSSAVTVASGTGVTSIDGVALPVSITSNPRSPLALTGQYQDIITITVQTTE